ncbi:MAG: hypothetical protein KGL39_41850 [Patescibacteria group bacterium]|nr:hypothetical protein [Patescibacteria group bacterium]
MKSAILTELPNREGDHPRGYVGWGPHEDAMCDKGNWRESISFPSWAAFWAEFADHDPDLNLVADFYFDQETRPCETCEREHLNGYNPATKRIADAFYPHSCPRDMKPWHDKITQDEVQALVDAGRLRVWDKEENIWKSPDPVPTAEAFNTANRRGGLDGHDAINHCILIKTRATRLGVYGHCAECDGTTYHETGSMVLNLWLLHPRKGASRGVEIKGVTESDLPQIRDYLRKSWEVHLRHWNWVTEESR